MFKTGPIWNEVDFNDFPGEGDYEYGGGVEMQDKVFPIGGYKSAWLVDI